MLPSTFKEKTWERGKAEKRTASELGNFKFHLGSDNWSNAAQRLGLASTMELLQYSRNLVIARNKLLIFANRLMWCGPTHMVPETMPSFA